MSVIQTIFSDGVLAMARTALLAALPDQYDWIGSLVITAASAVDDVERLTQEAGGYQGWVKFEAVADLLRSTLDAADDVPGWSELDEYHRDGLISMVIETIVFIRKIQTGALDRPAFITYVDAMSDDAVIIYDMIQSRKAAKAQRVQVPTDDARVAALTSSLGLAPATNE